MFLINLSYCILLWLTDDTLTKYCTSSDYGTVDGNTILDLEDDAAYVNMGAEWRMPTLEEQEELCSNCSWLWTTQNGVNGYKVTGDNGNSIFLPAAGSRYNSNLNNVGSSSGYWAGSLFEDYPIGAIEIEIGSNSYMCTSSNRCAGLQVRAVVR